MTMGAGNLPDPLLLSPPIIRQDLQKSSGIMVANGKKLTFFPLLHMFHSLHQIVHFAGSIKTVTKVWGQGILLLFSKIYRRMPTWMIST